MAKNPPICHLISSRLLDQYPAVRFAFSTRSGGISPEPLGMNLSFRVGDESRNVDENRRRFFSHLGFAPEEAAFPVQCHSNRAVVVSSPGSYEACDALLTNTPHVPLAVSVADCLPLFLFDQRIHAIAAIHAGWRGTVACITSEAVRIMGGEWGSDPSDLVAYLGPGADVCCYEIGPDVAGLFEPDLVELREGKQFLNLKKANVRQLKLSGLKEDNIEVCQSCTICRPDLFHSFRREKERSGRMMGVIVLA
ncbi:MAG: peptidoglycan editing factor PgeF [Bacteroidota bacterium]